MPDVAVMHYESFTPKDEKFSLARRDLGVSSFGLQMGIFDGTERVYPEHADDMEEVYIVLEGEGRLVADGEEHRLRPGVFARVGAGVRRNLIPDEGSELRVACLGGTPGKAYEPPAWTTEP